MYHRHGKKANIKKLKTKKKKSKNFKLDMFIRSPYIIHSSFVQTLWRQNKNRR